MSARTAVLILALSVSPAAAQPCDSGVTFSGPITITTGGAYTGNWQSTDPAVPAVTIRTREPVTIANSRIKGPGDLILGQTRQPSQGVTLAVTQSCFVGVNPNVAGKAKGSAIWLDNTTSLLVQNCDFESAGAYNIATYGYTGDHTPDNTIRVLQNRFHNVDGRFSDGNGGYWTTTDGRAAHAVILPFDRGVPGIEIAWNQIINDGYQSQGGDAINIYDSSGTPASPIQVHDNYIQGAYSANPGAADALHNDQGAITTDGPSQSDPGLTTSFLKIHDNQAVSLAHGGFVIANGHDIEMYANRVVSSGQLSDGANISTSTAQGFQYVNYSQDGPGVFANNSIHDNISGMRRQRNGQWERADFYFPVPPAFTANNTPWDPQDSSAPSLADEAHERLLWEEKLATHQMTIGSNLSVPAGNGSIKVIRGDKQAGPPGGTLKSPLTARVADSKGAPVANVNVSFLVRTGNATATRHFAVTDAKGRVSSGLVLGTAPATVQVTAIAVGYSSATFTARIRPH